MTIDEVQSILDDWSNGSSFYTVDGHKVFRVKQGNKFTDRLIIYPIAIIQQAVEINEDMTETEVRAAINAGFDELKSNALR